MIKNYFLIPQENDKCYCGNGLLINKNNWTLTCNKTIAEQSCFHYYEKNGYLQRKNKKYIAFIDVYKENIIIFLELTKSHKLPISKFPKNFFILKNEDFENFCNKIFLLK